MDIEYIKITDQTAEVDHIRPRTQKERKNPEKNKTRKKQNKNTYISFLNLAVLNVKKLEHMLKKKTIPPPPPT